MVNFCISNRTRAPSLCMMCIQASDALALTVARVQYMADGHILLSPREACHAALDDNSQGEVFHLLYFSRMVVCLFFLFVKFCDFLVSFCSLL